MTDAPRGVWLQYLSHRIEVPAGEFVIGRSEACQLSLDDERISRRHALLKRGPDAVTIEDLGSSNGVFVNGSRIDGRHALADGDRIELGAQKLLVRLFEAALHETAVAPSGPVSGDRPASGEASGDTVRPDPLATLDGDDLGEITRIGGRTSPPAKPADGRVHSLSLIGSIAEKALARGRPADAARVLKRPLDEIALEAQRGKAVPNDMASRAAQFAVRLADGTGEGAWVDYVVRLYRSLDVLLPAPVVDDLYRVIRRVDRFDLGALRAYAVRMRQRAPAYGPAERFVQQRLEGLERLATTVARYEPGRG